VLCVIKATAAVIEVEVHWPQDYLQNQFTHIRKDVGHHQDDLQNGNIALEIVCFFEAIQRPGPLDLMVEPLQIENGDLN
jgi:hypothetical protein